MMADAQDDLIKLCNSATNVYMTGNYIEATDNFGISKRGRNEGVWKAFY
jgi:hypothetical protein